MTEDHEDLIERILQEEERLIGKHNNSCKETIKNVEKEMNILKKVGNPDSDVKEYLESLDQILVSKITMLVDLRNNVLNFYRDVKSEEKMAKLHKDFNGHYTP